MRRLRKLISILACTSLLAVMMLVPSTASAVPQPPMQFHGDVTVAGAVAPDGIEILAKIDGITYARTTTFTNLQGTAGRYGDSPNLFWMPADDADTPAKEGGVNGDQVDIYVGGVLGDSMEFQVGSAGNELDLAVGTLPAAGAPTYIVQYTSINVDPPTFKWGEPLSAPGSVNYYQVKLNSGAWTSVGNSLQYAFTSAVGDGDHTLQVRLVDLFGDAGAAGTLNFSIDTTAVGPPSALTRTTAANDSTPTFAWGAAAGAALYEIKMNGGDWTDIANVLTYTHSTALDDGTHTFNVRAKDVAGNPSDVATLSNFTIDVTLPSKPMDLAKTTPDNDTTPTFSWTASTDATSGIGSYEVKIDDGSWSDTGSASATYMHTPLAYGTHTLQVRAKDGAGNVGAVTSLLFTLTSTVASTPISVSRTTADNDNTPTFTWDDLIGVDDYERKLDDGSWVSVDNSAIVYTYTTGITDGSHTFYVRAVGELTKWGSVTFNIDGTDPTMPSNLSRTTAANNNNPSFTWTHSTDERSGLAGYYIRLDAGEWVSIGYVNTYSYAFAISEGSHILYVKAKDVAGNYSAVSSVVFTIETVAPVVTVSSPNGGEVIKGTASSTVIWTTADSNRGTVKIEYSTNSGTSWNTIVASTADTGSYQWSVSSLNINTARVRVTATDQAGNIGSDTSNADFTIDSGAPVASGIGAQDATQTGIRIVWTTDESANTQVEYGTTVGYGSTTSLVSTLSTDHSVTISGLTPGTLYHYRVKSADRVGNQVVSADKEFSTAAASIVITISGVGSSNTTSYSTTISWATSVAAGSQVEYGTSAAYGATTALDSSAKTTHSVSISGLTPNTEYHYRVISGGALSADNNFTTLADGTAPTISGVSSSASSTSTASASWSTNEAATSQVVYDTSSHADGTKGDYALSTPIDSDLVLDHGAGLAGLLSNTTYYYRAVSKDSANNEVVSGEYSFTTLADTTGPAISGITESGITTTSASVSWLSAEQGTTQVFYDTASHAGGVPGDYTYNTSYVTTLSYGHSATIAGLEPGTTYYYMVVSKDASGNQTASAEGDLTTQADVTAPEVSGVSEANITSATVIILWLTDDSATSKVVYDITSRATAGAYALNSGADATADSTNHSVVLSSLLDSTTYYYRVVSKDASDNETVSAEYSFTTGDATPPAISNVDSVAITNTATGIVWITDEGATTQVVYSTTTHAGESYNDPDPAVAAAAAISAYGSSSAKDGSFRNGHGAVLTGLSSGVTYYYRVISEDGSGNQTISAEYSFITV